MSMRVLSRIGSLSSCWVVGAGSAPLVVGTGSARWRHTRDDDYSEKKFVDHVTVQARAGNGGQGCASVQKGRSRCTFYMHKYTVFLLDVSC